MAMTSATSDDKQPVQAWCDSANTEISAVSAGSQLGEQGRGARGFVSRAPKEGGAYWAFTHGSPRPGEIDEERVPSP